MRKIFPTASSTNGSVTASDETLCAPATPLTQDAEEHVIRRFRTQKTAALLALLALRGSQNRESVCALLWPDAVPEAARNSLSAALSALRRELGDETFVADRHRVTLRAGALTTDVDEFDSALKSGDAALAVELYGGHLLPGFHEDPFPSLSGEYTEKARGAFLSRVEELESRNRDVLGGLSLEERSDALRKVARRAILLFGDEERWFLALMRAHQMSGDIEAALRAYSSLQRHLRKDGELASEAARQLAKELRRQKEALSAAVPAPSTLPPWATPLPEAAGQHSAVVALDDDEAGADSAPAPSSENSVATATSLPFPPQWTRFFGREDERDLLRDWLSPSGALVTLSGPGGSGKTRLSLETLQELSKPQDGRPNAEGTATFFVPLASLTDAELFHQGVRDALGLSAAPNIAPLDQIERALKGSRQIVFLDNLEQLLPQAAPKLQALRERLPQTTFLVTSRVLLNLPGEREFPVTPLPTPLPRTNVAEVRTYPSVALFCDRAGLTLNEGNVEAVSTLCRRLDGIPLALELAAARAKVLSPAQILEKLASRPDFLQSRELGVPSRHRTLYATIEWSADLLSPELRAFFLKLSIFRGGWTLEAAEAVCGEPDALEFLTYLRESSLLSIEQNADESRFRMLETIREFGQERLGEVERAEVERALFHFFLELAQHAASAMRGPEQTAWLHRLDAEQDNLRTALTWARDHDPQRGLLLSTALIEFWETRLSLDEGRQWIETFLAATAPSVAATPSSTPFHVSRNTAPPEQQGATQPGLEVRSRALSGAGRLAWYANDYRQSAQLIERGLEVAQQSGNPEALIYPARSAARLAPIMNDVARAGELGRESIRLSRETGDITLLLTSLLDNVAVTIVVGDYPATREICREGSGLARELGDDRALAMLLYLEAIADFYEAQYAHARLLATESAALCRRCGARWDLMIALGVLASVMREQGDYAGSRRTFRECLAICREADLGDINVLHFLLSASYLLVRLGETVSAVQIMGACEAGAETIGYTLIAPMVPKDREFRAEARTLLGEAAFTGAWQRGRIMTTAQSLDFALRLLSEPSSEDALVTKNEETSLLTARSRALSGAGRLAWYASDLTEANSFLDKALEAAQQTGDTAAVVYATRSMARVTALAGDEARSLELGRESVRLSRQANDAALLLESLLDLSFAEVNAGDFEGARQTCEAAVTLARQEGDERSLALSLVTWAIIWDYSGDYEQGLPLIDESEAICRRLRLPWELMVCRALSGSILSKRGQHLRSQDAYNEALTICRAEFPHSWNVVNNLRSVSYSCVRRGEPRRAAQLMGAAEAMGEAINYSIMPFLVPDHLRFQALAQEVLGEASFRRAWQHGRQMSSEAAIDLAMQPVSLNTEADERQDTNEREIAPESEVQHAHERLLTLRAQALTGSARLSWYASDLNEANEALDRALEAAQQSGDVAAVIYATRSMARVLALAGEIERSRELGEESVRLSRATNDSLLLSGSLLDLAFAEINAGDFAASRRSSEEAATLARHSKDDHALVLALNIQGVICDCERQMDAALVFLEESEALCRRLGVQWELMICLSVMGSSWGQKGEFSRAQEFFSQALSIGRAEFLPSWTGVNTLYGAAYLCLRRGEPAKATQLMGAAEAISETITYSIMPLMLPQHEWAIANARQMLGESNFEMTWQRGRQMTPEAALELGVQPYNASQSTHPLPPPFEGVTAASKEALPPGTSAELLAVRSQALTGSGRLAWYASDLTGAGELIKEGLEAARAAEDQSSVIYATRSMARLAAVTGDTERSRDLARESVALSRQIGDPSLLLQSLVDLGLGDIGAEDFVGASRTCREATALARKLGDEQRLTLSLINWGIAEHYQGANHLARPLAVEAEAVSRRVHLAWELMVCLGLLGRIASEEGEFEAAHTYFCEAFQICLDSDLDGWNIVNLLHSTSYGLLCRFANERATELMGAAEAMGESIGYTLMPVLMAESLRCRTQARERLGAVLFEKLWQRGGILTPSAAIALAMQPILVADVNQGTNASESSNDAEVTDELLILRSRALSGASWLTWMNREAAISRAWLEEGLANARRTGDVASLVGAASAAVRLALSTGDDERDLPQALALNQEAVERARAVGERPLLLDALLSLGYLENILERGATMRAIHEEAVQLARALGDEQKLARILVSFVSVALFEGEYEEAERYLVESEEISHRVKSPFDLLGVHWSRMLLSRDQNNFAMAHTAMSAALMLCRDHVSISWPLCNVLLGASQIFFAEGDAESAAVLIGVVQAQCAATGYRFPPHLRHADEKLRAQARDTLGEATFEKYAKRGRLMTSDEAIDFTLKLAEQDAPKSGADTSPLSKMLIQRSLALSGASRLTWMNREAGTSRAWIEESLAAARQTGDTVSLVSAVSAAVRFVISTGDDENELAHVLALSQEAVEKARACGDRPALLEALLSLGYMENILERVGTMRAIHEEAMQLARALGDERKLARVLINLVSAARQQGEYEAAERYLAESEAIAQRLNTPFETLSVAWSRVMLARDQKDFAVARAALILSLQICRDNATISWSRCNVLLVGSQLFCAEGDYESAAVLAGATQSLSKVTGYNFSPLLRHEDERFQTQTREALGEAAFERSVKRGRLMTSEEATSFAIQRAMQDTPESGQGTDALLGEQLIARSRALSGASRMTWLNRETGTSRAWIEESLDAARQTGDATSFVFAAAAFVRFAMSTGDGDLPRACELNREAVQRAREVSDKSVLLEALLSLGYAETAANELGRMRAIHTEALSLARELGDEQRLARVLTNFATLAYTEKKYAEANRYLDESTRICRQLNSFGDVMAALWTRSFVAREQGQLEVSRGAIHETLQICRDNSVISWGRCNVLLTASHLWCCLGEAERATLIMGAVQSHAEATDYQLIPFLRVDADHYEVTARTVLGEALFEDAWERGRLMTSEEAIELAMQPPTPKSPEDGGIADISRSQAEEPEGSGSTDPLLVTRARALSGASRLAWHDADFSASYALVEQGVAAARASGDVASFVYATAAFVRFAQANNDIKQHLPQALSLAEEAVNRSREAGESNLLLPALTALCSVRMTADQMSGLRPMMQEAVSLARTLGERQSLVDILTLEGSEAFYSGDAERARGIFEECLALSRRLGATWNVMSSLFGLSSSYRELGELQDSDVAIREALTICSEHNVIRWEVPLLLLTMSYLRFRYGHVEGAAQLMGASESLRENLKFQIAPVMDAEYQRFLALVRAALDATAFQTLWLRGRRMSATDAVEFALRPLSEVVTTELVVSKTFDPSLIVRARALSGAARLAWHKGDFEGSRQLVEGGLSAATQAGDTTSFVYAVAAFVRFAIMDAAPHHLVRAITLSEQAVQRSRETGETNLLIQSLTSLGYSRVCANQLEDATPLMEEAVELARSLDDGQSLVLALNVLGAALHFQDDYAQSRRLYQEATQRSRSLDLAWCLISSLWGLATAARELRDWEVAESALRESIEIALANESIRWQVAHQLLSVSYLRFRRGDTHNAAQMMGAAATMRDTLNYQLPPVMVVEYERFHQEVQDALDKDAFQEAWQRGQSLNADEAVDLALRLLSAPLSLDLPTSKITTNSIPRVGEGSTDPDPFLTVRARALSGAGRLAWREGNFDASRALVEQGLEAAAEAGDTASFVYAVVAFVRFAWTNDSGEQDLPRACQLGEEAVQRSRVADDPNLLLQSLTALGGARLCLQDFERSRPLMREAVTLARNLGDAKSLSEALIAAGGEARYAGDYAEGLALYEESLGLARAVNLSWHLTSSLWGISSVARESGDFVASEAAIQECLVLCRTTSSPDWETMLFVLTASYLAFRKNEFERAAQLMGAVEALHETINLQLTPVIRAEYQRYHTLVHEALDEATLQAAWQRGRRMTLAEAVDFALTTPASLSESNSSEFDPTLTVRARALSGASRLAWHNGDFDATRELMEQGLTAARQTGDAASIVHAIGAFGRFAMTSSDEMGDIPRALMLSEEAVQLSRANGDHALLLEALTALCYVRVTSNNDIAGLRPIHTEAIALAKELEDKHGLVRMYVSASATEYYEGQYEVARAFLDECLPLCRGLNSPWDVQAFQWMLASVTREQGQVEVACAAVVECLDISRENSAMRWGVANMLLSASYLLLRCGDPSNAVVLMGAAQGLCENINYHMSPIIELERAKFETIARTQLGNPRFATAWQRGLLMSPERAMDFAERAVEKAVMDAPVTSRVEEHEPSNMLPALEAS